jgi:hypothetical protein
MKDYTFPKIDLSTHNANPMFRAAIAERASIDGDVPEFRDANEPLPVEGFRPAISVVTDSLNPILVGLMLERASREIEGRFQIARDSAEQTALALSQPANLPVSVQGYVAGEIPEPMVVEAPPASILADLPPDRARYFSWLSFATTQGRRSLAPAIQAELERRLGVSAGVYKRSTGHSDIRWLMTVFGPDDLLEDFSPVESAVSYFEGVLRNRFEQAGTLPFVVIPVASIPERQFGWVVRTGVAE